MTKCQKEEAAKPLCRKAQEIDTRSPAKLHFSIRSMSVTSAPSPLAQIASSSLVRIARKTMPESLLTADAAGSACYKPGSAGAALAPLKESVQKVPRNPIFPDRLGMAYLAARQVNPACQSLPEALQTGAPNRANSRTARQEISAGVR